MALFPKRSKMYGIMNFLCPKCHKGNLFEHGIWAFKGSFEMNDTCPNCEQTFMPEPGFYYGAMLVSYILSSFFCLSFIYFCKLILGFSTNKSFAILLVICSVGFIWVFRIARSIWINVHVKYDGE